MRDDQEELYHPDMIRELEDQSDLEAAQQALGEAKREGTVPWDQVKAELGLQL